MLHTGAGTLVAGGSTTGLCWQPRGITMAPDGGILVAGGSQKVLHWTQNIRRGSTVVADMEMDDQ